MDTLKNGILHIYNPAEPRYKTHPIIGKINSLHYRRVIREAIKKHFIYDEKIQYIPGFWRDIPINDQDVSRSREDEGNVFLFNLSMTSISNNRILCSQRAIIYNVDYHTGIIDGRRQGLGQESPGAVWNTKWGSQGEGWVDIDCTIYSVLDGANYDVLKIKFSPPGFCDEDVRVINIPIDGTKPQYMLPTQMPSVYFNRSDGMGGITTNDLVMISFTTRTYPGSEVYDPTQKNKRFDHRHNITRIAISYLEVTNRNDIIFWGEAGSTSKRIENTSEILYSTVSGVPYKQVLCNYNDEEWGAIKKGQDDNLRTDKGYLFVPRFEKMEKNWSLFVSGDNIYFQYGIGAGDTQPYTIYGLIFSYGEVIPVDTPGVATNNCLKKRDRELTSGLLNNCYIEYDLPNRFNFINKLQNKLNDQWREAWSRTHFPRDDIRNFHFSVTTPPVKIKGTNKSMFLGHIKLDHFIINESRNFDLGAYPVLHRLQNNLLEVRRRWQRHGIRDVRNYRLIYFNFVGIMTSEPPFHFEYFSDPFIILSDENPGFLNFPMGLIDLAPEQDINNDFVMSLGINDDSSYIVNFNAFSPENLYIASTPVDHTNTYVKPELGGFPYIFGPDNLNTQDTWNKLTGLVPGVHPSAYFEQYFNETILRNLNWNVYIVSRQHDVPQLNLLTSQEKTNPRYVIPPSPEMPSPKYSYNLNYSFNAHPYHNLAGGCDKPKYNYIINPITNRKVSVHGKTGKKILKQYLKNNKK